MSRTETLQELEGLLESFLDRVVQLKEQRLEVLGGINRIDDIARGFKAGQDLTDTAGQWFAEHRRWLAEGALRPADRTRIGEILDGIREELRVTGPDSPAVDKIAQEIDRWQASGGQKGRRIVLERKPERPAPQPQTNTELDSIARFDADMEHMLLRFRDFAGPKEHLLSVLDDTLRSAEIQANKEALILSALIIYYLRQENYKVEPYVRRLKQAEKTVRERGQYA